MTNNRDTILTLFDIGRLFFSFSFSAGFMMAHCTAASLGTFNDLDMSVLSSYPSFSSPETIISTSLGGHYNQYNPKNCARVCEQVT